MRYKIIIMILLTLLLSFGQSIAMTVIDKPDWLHGKLLINTKGSEMILPVGSKPMDQMICCLDFDNDLCLSVKVPTNCSLANDLYSRRPLVIYPMDACYETEDTYRTYEWRTAGYESIALDGGKLSLSSMDNQFVMGRFPITILSLGESLEKEPEFFSDGECISRIYLGYGLGDDGDLSIQLIDEIGSALDPNPEFKVLRNYPNEYPLGSLFFSLSEKQCAVRDIDQEIDTIDLFDSSVINGPRGTEGAICWLDENIVYFVRSVDSFGVKAHSPIEVRIWNSQNGQDSNIAKLWNGNDFLLPVQQTPLSIMVNHDATILAIYLPGSIDATHPIERGGRILFVSLSNGEVFEFMPWNTTVTDIEHKGYFHGYCFTDDGNVIYDPYYLLNPQITWL